MASTKLTVSTIEANFAALDNAMCTTGQILDQFGSQPWLSLNQEVIDVWNALTRPENLSLLDEWLSRFQGNMNPWALRVTTKAIETCRDRQATNT